MGLVESPDYRRHRGGPTEVNYGASVRPRRSLVGSPNFESVTPFHGMATPSGDRRVVKNDGVPPSVKIGARGVTVYILPRYIIVA